MLHHRHPFYRHSEAAFFAAERGGVVVARIGVHENTMFNQARGRRWAFFHLFEAEDDEAGAAVLAAAKAWASARGLERMVGPMGFLPGEAMGILVDGFEHPASMIVPWHPPSYAAMVAAQGFTKEADFTSGVGEAPREVPAEVAELLEGTLAEAGVQVRSLTTRREVRRHAVALGDLYNRSFADNWEFRPLTPEEAIEVAVRALPIMDPRLVVLVERDGEMAGFLLAIPDARAGLRQARGRLLPIGWWHILRAARRSDWAELVGMGIVPEHRRTGANVAIYGRAMQIAAAFGYRGAEFIQVEEDNDRVRRNLAVFGVRWNRRHRVYGCDL